jgi:hypothetical protein
LLFDFDNGYFGVLALRTFEGSPIAAGLFRRLNVGEKHWQPADGAWPPTDWRRREIKRI